jgi:hypothetical protein
MTLRVCSTSLDGNVRRAIDLRECDEADEKAFEALICAPAALNTSSGPKTEKHLPGAPPSVLPVLGTTQAEALNLSFGAS